MTKPAATILAMLAVLGAPVAVQAQDASREGAKVDRSEALGRFATPLLLFLAGAAVIVTIILLDKDDENTPASP